MSFENRQPCVAAICRSVAPASQALDAGRAPSHSLKEKFGRGSVLWIDFVVSLRPLRSELPRKTRELPRESRDGSGHFAETMPENRLGGGGCSLSRTRLWA